MLKVQNQASATDGGTPLRCATVDYPGAAKIEQPINYQAQEGGPEGKTRNIRSVGPDVNLVGIGSETPSHYLRTGRTADLGYAHTRHQKP